jgi:hypothetical protein
MIGPGRFRTAGNDLPRAKNKFRELNKRAAEQIFFSRALETFLQFY